MKYWYFPTSFENAFSIISANIIAQKENYKNYYIDIRDDYECVLPLIEDKNLSGINWALSKAKTEDDRLKTCIFEFSSTSLAPFRAGQKAKDGILELRRELSLSSISSIIFTSKDDLNEFLAQSSLRKNVIVTTNLKVASIDFIKAGEIKQSNDNLFKSDNNINDKATLIQADALGGVLLALFYFSFSTYGKLLFDYFLKENKKQVELGEYEKMIYEYFYGTKVLNEKKLKMIELCINSINHEYFQESLLNFLENSNSIKLLEILQNIQKNELNKQEIIKYVKLLSLPEKILILLFLKESLEDFIEYADLYLAPNEAAVIAMFFGLRDGYKKTYNKAKHNKTLQNSISDLMTSFVWQKKGFGNIKFKKQKEPSSLYELAQDYMK